MSARAQKYLFGSPNCAVLCGDSRDMLRGLKDCADLIVTSPPYADARKNHYDSIHPDQFADWFMTFHSVFWDVLKPEGSLVINIKDKIVNGTRHRYVWHTIEALSKAGWHCIDDFIWNKLNPMPGHWPTRLRDGWEYCFHLSKSPKPYMNQDAVRVPIGNWVKTRLSNMAEDDFQRHNSANESGFGRNISYWVDKQTVKPSNVLSLAVVGKNKGHPAVFPPDLPLFFIKLLCPPNGLVIDPFAGSGTTGMAAMQTEQDCILVDNNVEYSNLSIELLKELNEKRNFNILSLKSLDAKNKDYTAFADMIRQHQVPDCRIDAV